jgi:hypothetical protein
MTMTVPQTNGATFSPDRKHRYSLWRTIDRGKLTVLFIGLNPSTADETRDDPTIRRCMGFAKQWGFSKMYMGNLFSYVTAYPKELTEDNCLKNDAENKQALAKMAQESFRVVLCWGNNGWIRNQGKEIAEYIDTQCTLSPVCFGINKNGQPKHPLYLPKNAEVMKYDTENLQGR